MVDRFAGVLRARLERGRRQARVRAHVGSRRDERDPTPRSSIQHEEPTPPGLVTPWLRDARLRRSDSPDRHRRPTSSTRARTSSSSRSAPSSALTRTTSRMDQARDGLPRRRPCRTTCPSSGSASAARCWRGCWAGTFPAATSPRSAGCPSGRPIPSSSRRARGSSGTSTRSRRPRRDPVAESDGSGRRRSSRDAASGSSSTPRSRPRSCTTGSAAYRHELDERGRRPGRAARRDRPQRRGEPADRAAAARALPRPGRAARIGRDRRDDPTPTARPCSTASSTWLYPNIERGEGVWLTTTDGRRILDACSGGAMVACPRSRRRRDRRGRGRAGGEDSRTSTTTTSRASRRNGSPTASSGFMPGDGAGAVRLRRVRGERDGAAARAAVSRRTRRHRPLARDLAGAGLPRRPRWGRSR